jgi:outer membrane cobalamin receptor
MNYSQNSKTKFRTLLGSALAAALFCAPSARAVQPADDQAFITLTRTPVEEKKLPTNVSVVRSEQIEKLGIQNAGDAIDYLSSVNVQKTENQQAQSELRNPPGGARRRSR